MKKNKSSLKFSGLKNIELKPKKTEKEDISKEVKESEKLEKPSPSKPTSEVKKHSTENQEQVYTSSSPEEKTSFPSERRRRMLTSDPELAAIEENYKKPSGFLNKIFSIPEKLEVDRIWKKSLDSDYQAEAELGQHTNSFSAIFNPDEENIYGVRRVFKKSLYLLLADLLFFGIFTVLSLNFFSSWLPIAMLALTLTTSITVIFYTILAERSYFYISLLIKAAILLLIYSILGEAFTILTITGILLVILFFYLSYNELEKEQISSRLFSITHISVEAVRMLSTGVVLVLALTVFNQANSLGSKEFITQSFLENEIVMNELLIGRGRLNLNQLLIEGSFQYDSSKDSIQYFSRPATFRDFLAENFRAGDPVLSEAEVEGIREQCARENQTLSCDEKIQNTRTERLEDWRLEAYTDLSYQLDTVLTRPIFAEVVTNYYGLEIASFEAVGDDIEAAEEGDSTASAVARGIAGFQIIPVESVIPAVIGFAVLIIFMLFKFLIHWLVLIFLNIFWSILKMTGFVRIEVEHVEAEVVSI